MTFKRNGGIFFVSAFGFSATFCRKARAPKAKLSRNPVLRVRQIMAQEEDNRLPMSVSLIAGTFGASVLCFASALSTIL